MGLPVDEVRAGIGRNATTLELFFDLVYVFAITQVVRFVHNEPSLPGLGKGAFLLLLLWWTWSIYTWTTNWSGTGSTQIKVFLLAAMGATLVMGMAVPASFGDSAALFGVSYFLVRILVTGLYWFESRDYTVQRAAFWTFYPISVTAALLVLVGALLEGRALLILFAAGGVLDLFGAANAGRGTWAVDAAHFAERNGLFIIIALGESVVGLGLTATGVEVDLAHTTALMVSFVGVAALWWAYFDRAAPEAEHYFRTLTGKAPGRFARDAYTYLHYPLVVGIVFFAIGLEEVVAHPAEPLALGARVAMAGGISLALAAVLAVTHRSTGVILRERALAALSLLALIWLGEPWQATAFAAAAVSVTLFALLAERAHAWPASRQSAY